MFSSHKVFIRLLCENSPLVHTVGVLETHNYTNSFTHHFSLGAEEGMALESLIVLALDNVGKHFVVHFVRSAI